MYGNVVVSDDSMVDGFPYENEEVLKIKNAKLEWQVRRLLSRIETIKSFLDVQSLEEVNQLPDPLTNPPSFKK